MRIPNAIPMRFPFNNTFYILLVLKKTHTLNHFDFEVYTRILQNTFYTTELFQNIQRLT